MYYKSFIELRCIFWATLHLLSYSVPYCAALHSIELCCTHGAIPHPTEIYHTLLSYTAHCWATLHPVSYPIIVTLHPIELGWTLLRYPTCTLHPIELCCTLLNYAESSEQCCTLLRHGPLYWAPYRATVHLLSCAAPCWAVVHQAELRCPPLWASSP